MAKKKKADAAGVVKSGDNQMPPEMIQQYVADIKAFDKDLETARGEVNRISGARRNKLRSFKSNGGDIDELLHTIAESKLDADELQRRIKLRTYYRECMNLGKIPGGDLLDQAVAHDYFDRLFSLGLRQGETHDIQPPNDYPEGSDEAKMITAGFMAKQREKIEAVIKSDNPDGPEPYKAPANRQEWMEQMKREEAAEAGDADAEAEAAERESVGEDSEQAEAVAEDGDDAPLIEEELVDPAAKTQAQDDGKPLDHGWDEAAPPAGTKLN